ncbi:hypothetical protein PanWU01x14_185810 [Parasponia andersonii]|uniref:RNase H type-1 domain-containing protein n=1 Tax=Parasponia andersonii TaxID=3476 RepID=A0A2P5C3Y4_PARAD|nr:hypothetical protein PanWU01x14_185810 [Parasponia andersonii]
MPLPPDNSVDLLIENGNKWNEKLIQDLFHSVDYKIICNISLGDGSLDDCLMWHYDKREAFSLAKRHIPVKDACPWYNSNPETTSHALLFSPVARSLWKLSPISEQVRDQKEVPVMWMTLQAQSKKREFMSSTTVSKNSHPRTQNRWQPPPVSMMKLNVDAAVKEEEACIRISGIIRNHLGEVLSTFCSNIKIACSAGIAEAIALRYGNLLCKRSWLGPLDN